GRAGRGDNRRSTEYLSELDSRHAHAAACCLNQRRLSWLQGGCIPNRDQRAQVRHRQRGRVLETNGLRQLRRLVGGRYCKLGVTTLVDQRDDAVAWLEALDSCS